MKNKQLEIIITTIGNKIINLLKNFYPSHSDVSYQIHHQNHKKNDYNSEINDFLNKRRDVVYYNYQDKGLSKNRNHSLLTSKGNYCLISDDDLIYTDNAFNKIINSFKNYPEADILTFKTKFPNGKDFKRYAKRSYKHNFRSIMRVTSFEIAYRRKSIEQAGIKWDEEFGIGGKPFTNGIENIFLVDALKSGLKAYFIPKTIVIHPFDNSGYNYSKHLIESKGAMFARMFGKHAYWLNILFALKKYKDYKNIASILKFIKLANIGAIKYIKMKKGLT